MDICGEHGILPSSCIIPESKIQKLGDSPISSDGFSGVLPGWYGERTFVTVKSIRHREPDKVRDTKKVGHPDLSPPRPSLIIRRTSVEKP